MLARLQTIGYGDILPSTNAERVYALLTQLTGVLFYSYVVATVSAILASQNYNERMLHDRLDAICSYLQHRNFPFALAFRVRKYFKHYFEQKSALVRMHARTHRRTHARYMYVGRGLHPRTAVARA